MFCRTNPKKGDCKTMTIKKKIAAAIIVALAGFASPASAMDGKTEKNVLATVNGTDITKDLYDFHLNRITREKPINDPEQLAVQPVKARSIYSLSIKSNPGDISINYAITLHRSIVARSP